jgi:hypothetical protein
VHVRRYDANPGATDEALANVTENADQQMEEDLDDWERYLQERCVCLPICSEDVVVNSVSYHLLDHVDAPQFLYSEDVVVNSVSCHLSDSLNPHPFGNNDMVVNSVSDRVFCHTSDHVDPPQALWIHPHRVLNSDNVAVNSVSDRVSYHKICGSTTTGWM